ncbi:MAG: hypothetical protein R2752_11195 [Vicinamibacterales bacterium]
MAGDVAVEARPAQWSIAPSNEFGRLDVMVCNAGIGFHGAH